MKLSALENYMPPATNKCCICRKPLTMMTGRQPMDDGIACDDCYYDALGALIEEHPIRRGHR